METPEPSTLVARVLALDISTSVCGAAVLEIYSDARVRFCNFFAVDASAERSMFLRVNSFKRGDTEQERFGRIRCAAKGLRMEVCGTFYDYIAYEVPNQRGAGATAGLWQAIGAVLERVQPNVTVPLLPIHASTAKAVVGTAGVRAAGETAQTLDEKTRAVQWLTSALCEQSDVAGMMTRFLGRLRVEQEAIADAAAVGVATVPMLMPGMQACCDRRKSLPKAKKPKKGGSK